MKQETMQHLEEVQPKRPIDIDTKMSTRNYLDWVYETAVDAAFLKGADVLHVPRPKESETPTLARGMCFVYIHK